MFREHGEDVGNVISGIHHNGLVGRFVAEDGAVATEQADRKGLANHWNSSQPTKAEAQAVSLRFCG
jgi:hypothetical protein